MMRLVSVLLAALAGLAAEPVATIRLEAPFDELFESSQLDPKYTVTGTLNEPGGQAVPVKISVRGHTSRRESECTFPKLKIERADGSQLKIGTHCSEATDNKLTAKYGRLPNERSPWREAAVYQILDAVGVPTLQAKAARVTYVFPDSRTVARNALLLEDDDAAVKRLGGEGLIDAPAFTTVDQLFSPADAATMAFAQALIGNFDWCVKFSANDTYRCDARMKLWNVLAVKTKNGKARPVVHDFDVTGMVAGSHHWFREAFNAAFVPSKSQREVEVISQVQRTRTLFPRGELDAARQRFMAKKDAASRALADAPLDDEGRVVIQEYLDAFYQEIGSDDRFYRPVVIVEGTMARAEPGASAPAICPSRGPIPVGTPVGQPLDTRGEFVNVVLLDALWHWATPNRCPQVKTGAVWIPSSAIARDFPKR